MFLLIVTVSAFARSSPDSIDKKKIVPHIL